MKKFVYRLRLALPALIYFVIYLSWFFLLEKLPGRDYTIIHMQADDKIPFCEYFIIPYLLWFFYIAWIMLYLFFKDIKDFYKCCMFMFSGMTIFLIISTLFPNIHYLRPSIMPRDTIFTRMVQFLYRVDTSTNLWPSIHVYNSLGVFFAVSHNKRLGSQRFVKYGCGFLTTLIILSTMFLKQHSVFDVMTGILMGLILYILTYHTGMLENLRIRVLYCKKRRQHKTRFN